MSWDCRHNLICKACLVAMLIICLLPNEALGNTWIEKADSPESGGYGEVVVGTGTYLYAVKCYSVGSIPKFWRYNPSSDFWEDLNNSGLPNGVFRNGTAMAWDKNNYIYVLAGARYSDPNRREFYRYSISNDNWIRMTDTPSPQGAGNAITWSGHDSCIYTILGSSNSQHQMAFAQYDPVENSWITKSNPPDRVDDGCSLVWTGNSELYALRGEFYETSPLQDFWKYDIDEDMWSRLANIPAVSGVGDGGSLLWIGDFKPRHANFIYALSGGGCWEDSGYDYFRYSIADNNWTQLTDLSYPVGYFNGNRLGFAGNRIYCWQGTTSSSPGGGSKFGMYQFFSPYPVSIPTIFPMGLVALLLIISLILIRTRIRN
ncbi:hypothetical protein K8T06_12620 [bacterium]|nr:hypothetical protein [bacterium]